MPKFEVAESIVVDADLAHVRGIVADFKQWEPWSPWLSSEPDCPLEYAEDGKSYSWDGKIIGSGRMELVKTEDEALWFHLTFLKPWKSESDVDFQFEPAGEGTKVTWRMQGSLPFFMFWMKKMMRGWIGQDYRRGLSKLKDYAESGKVPSQMEFPGLGDGLSTAYVGVRTQCSIDDIGPTMNKQMEKLHKWMDGSGLEPSGSPMAIGHKFDMAKGIYDFTPALPVPEVPGNLPGGFSSGTIDAQRTFKVKHTGAYRHLGCAWSAGMMLQRSKAFRPNKACDPFELYLNDPTETSEDALVTEIHFPAR